MLPYRGAKFLFKKLFGQYFQYELEKDQFDIGFKKGTINLSNLELNIRRINQDLGQSLPLALASGFIGNILTKVPYTSLWESNSEFTIKDLELSFVSSNNYENIVLPKINELHDGATSTIHTEEGESFIPQYYSDEDEDVDNNSNQDNHFGMEGLEALLEMIKKLVDKVSAKITNCTISIVHHSNELNKSIILLLTIDQIEYCNDDNNIGTTNSNSVDYFYKRIKINNLVIRLAQVEGNILNDQRYYTSSIFTIIKPTQFQTIFTNKPGNNNNNINSSSSNNAPIDQNDYVQLKIKRNERNNNLPLLNTEFNFKDWVVLLSPTQLYMINNFIKIFSDNNITTTTTTTTTTPTSSTSTIPTKKQNQTSPNKPTSTNSQAKSPPATLSRESSFSSIKGLQQQQQQQLPINYSFHWGQLKIFLFTQDYDNLYNEFLKQHHYGSANFFLLYLQDLHFGYSRFGQTKQYTINIGKFNFSQNIDNITTTSPTPNNSHSTSTTTTQSKRNSSTLKSSLDSDLNNMIHPNLYTIIQFHDNKNHLEEKYDISGKITFYYQNDKCYDKEINIQLKDISIYFYPFLLQSFNSFWKQTKGLFTNSKRKEQLFQIKKIDSSSPIIASTRSYHEILSEIKNTGFLLNDHSISTPFNTPLDNTASSMMADEMESTSTRLQISTHLIKLHIKFPDTDQFLNNNVQQLRKEIVTINITNVKIVSNMIKDIKDLKWLIDFDEINSNLTNEMNDTVRFLDIIVRDQNNSVDSGHTGGVVTPLEITIKGDHGAFSNYDIDLNSPVQSRRSSPPIPSSNNNNNNTPPSPNQHFNPFEFNSFQRENKRKGPFSHFVSMSEGDIFNNDWLDEAEQDELTMFRHSSIESSKNIINIIIPKFKIEMKKEDLILLNQLFESLTKFLKEFQQKNQQTQQLPQLDDYHQDQTQEENEKEKVEEEEEELKDQQEENDQLKKSGKSFLSVLLIINQGTISLVEIEDTKSRSPYYNYVIDFNQLDLYSVSNYFGRDVHFVNGTVDQLSLKELDLSKERPKPRMLISRTLNTQKFIVKPSIVLNISINNEGKSGFLDEILEDSLLYIGLRGITLEHRLHSNWYSRIANFFNLSEKDGDHQQEIVKDSNDSSSGGKPLKKLVNLMDCSITYVPSSNLTSAAVLLFTDTKFIIRGGNGVNDISCNGKNTYLFVVDDVQHLTDHTAMSHSSISAFWKNIGFEQSIYLDYYELQILFQSQFPSFSLNFNQSNISITACSDSFFTLNELISNLFGLDIPYQEVADLIITQGIAMDLKDNIDILVNEDMLKNSPYTTGLNSFATHTSAGGGGGGHNNITNSSSTISPSPSPLVNSFSNTPSLEFEDFEEDPSIYYNDGFSEDEEEDTFYEYHSPPNEAITTTTTTTTTTATSRLSDSSSSLLDFSSSNDIIQETSSQTSAPIIGSLVIEDYDHQQQQSTTTTSTTNNQEQYTEPQQQQGQQGQQPHELSFYVDLDQMSERETISENNPYPPSPTPPFTSIHKTEGSTIWFDPRVKSIEPIENYITTPAEDPEEYDLPSNYPKSVDRVLIRKINISFKIYKGSDWEIKETIPSLSTTKGNNNNNNNRCRETNSYVEFIVSDFNLRIDKFEETEMFSKRLSIQILDLTIIDHIPTSVWNKFLCSDTNVTRYQQSPMIKILMETIRPDLNRPLLQENKLKVLILPLWFNIDQDTITFISNFFTYKPLPPQQQSPRQQQQPSQQPNSTGNSLESSPLNTRSYRGKKVGVSTRSIPEEKAQTTEKEAQEMTYFQSCEILPIRLKVDYKPKKIDYHSLTSGNYAELLNLLPLEGAIFNLNRLKLVGVAGWSSLFNQIGKNWALHIFHTQLMGYVSGVRGINSLVHVGESLANLVVLPLEQYKKDGKVLKGLKKGTTNFLKNLTLESLALGAKLAIGTQGLLETADTVLSSSKKKDSNYNNNSSGNNQLTVEQQQNTSPLLQQNTPPLQHQSRLKSSSSSSSLNNYYFGGSSSKLSDQPNDTKEGIQHAYESVSREIKSAAHTIIAIPMQEYTQKGPKGYVKSMVKAVPIAIIRPMKGITEGTVKTLLGIRNQIDPLKKVETDAKYKKGQQGNNNNNNNMNINISNMNNNNQSISNNNNNNK